MVKKESRLSLDSALWRLVDRVHRLPAWKRTTLIGIWVLAITALVYFWMTAFDCPFC
jgi:hypothetical protein